MIFVKELTSSQIQQLKEISRKEVGRVSTRAHMVLMSARNVAVPTISALYEVCPATVRFWIRKYETEGPAGLYDDMRSGRPRTRNRNGNGSGNGTGNGNGVAARKSQALFMGSLRSLASKEQNQRL